MPQSFVGWEKAMRIAGRRESLALAGSDQPRWTMTVTASGSGEGLCFQVADC